MCCGAGDRKALAFGLRNEHAGRERLLPGGRRRVRKGARRNLVA